MAGPEHVWILVPAAGESQRFKDAGYPTPKPLLRVAHPALNRGVPCRMVDHVANSLSEINWPRLMSLPAGASSESGSGTELSESLRSTGRFYVSEIERSRGQADTLRQMIRWLPRRHLDKTAVVILNCDVVFKDRDSLGWLVERVLTGFSASMLVVDSINPAMSYAAPYPCPQKFVEKECISRDAMAGAWAFASASRLLSALDWACCQGRREPYLSQAIGRINGPKIAQRIDSSDMLDWGTPKLLKESGAVVVGRR